MTTPPPLLGIEPEDPIERARQIAERQARLAELQAQARGWDALNATVEPPNLVLASKTGAPVYAGMEDDAAARQVLEEQMGVNRAEQEKILAAIAGDVQQGRAIAARSRLGLPPSAPTAAPPPAPAPQLPPAAAAPDAPPTDGFKTIIVSRRDPSGKIVAETMRVPADSGRQSYESGLGGRGGLIQANVAPTDVPFSEQIRNLAGTMPKIDLTEEGGSGFGLNAPGSGGNFQGYRQLSGLEQSLARNQHLQQRGDQELEREQGLAARAQALEMGGAGIEESRAKSTEARGRGQLAVAQAGLTEEQLLETQQPELRAQRQLMEYNTVVKSLAPEIQRAVEAEIATFVDASTRAGTPPDAALLALVRQKALAKHSGTSYEELVRRMQMLTPAGYAATVRGQGFV